MNRMLAEPKQYFPLVCHELVHIAQRLHRDKFRAHYQSIGFDLFDRPELIENKIINPDSRDLYLYRVLSIVPFLSLSNGRPGTFIFDVKSNQVCELSFYKEYLELFAPNPNVSSPDEILANSFGMVIYGVMFDQAIDPNLMKIVEPLVGKI